MNPFIEMWYCHTPCAWFRYDCWNAPAKLLLYALFILALLWFLLRKKNGHL